MRVVEPASWTPEQCALWDRIAAHALEHPDHALDFTQRLARDHGWSLAFTRSAVAEYRRFCFLAVIGGGPVTPSEEIDEVWHQHLTFSRDYWDIWCARVLGAPLHHGPTEGGPIEDKRYRKQYADTLARYESYFGDPDQTYWPPTHRRFGAVPRFRVVDREIMLVVRRPMWLLRNLQTTMLGLAAVITLCATLPALAQPLNPFDWTAGPFLTLYGVLGAVTVFAVLALCRRARDAGAPPAGTALNQTNVERLARDLDVLDVAWLAGGRTRVAQTVLVGLVEAGAARVPPSQTSLKVFQSNEIEITRNSAPVPALLDRFAVAEGSLTQGAFQQAIRPQLEALEADLARRGLAPQPAAVKRARRVTFLIVGLVAAFGAVKLIVGLSRDKPVGFLALLIALMMMITAMMRSRVITRTTLGRGALDWLQVHHSRAAAAPRDGELLFAFALGGVAVLSGTDLSELVRVFASSGGGGGGDGGGGCGGCGGGN